MCHRLVPVAALLLCCAGESSPHAPPERVWAFAGGDVVLPCSFNATAGDDFPAVEWSKRGLQPNVVLLYKNHCEDYAMKNPAFKYRTSLLAEELQNGNISLRLSDVRPSDAGKYQCMRLWTKAPREITTVELVVAAVSEPKLSVTSAESGGVALQCEADCWPLEPEISFLDDQGNGVPADDPKRAQGASGCYTVTRRATLQGATSRVTCRAHQPEINQTRDMQILIAVDCIRSCSLTTGLAVGEAALLLSALLGLTIFFFVKGCGKCAKGPKLPVSRQSSDQSTVSGASANQPLLQRDQADGVAKSTIERLTSEVADLNAKLRLKEDTIRQLQNDNKSPPTPVLCQLGQPTIPCSPAASTDRDPPISGILPQNQGPKAGISRQNSNPPSGPPIPKNRVHSSPNNPYFDAALLSASSSANASRKKLGDIGRGKSESFAQPRPKVAKLQRRHSTALTFSTLSNNRFTPLVDLTEESD